MFSSCLPDGRIFNGRIRKDISQLVFGDRSRLVGRSDQAVDGCGVFAAGVRAREQVIRQGPLQVFKSLSTMPFRDARCERVQELETGRSRKSCAGRLVQYSDLKLASWRDDALIDN